MAKDEKNQSNEDEASEEEVEVSPSTGKKKPDKDKKKKKGWLSSGAESVPLLIIAYAVFVAKNFHSQLYPVFPEFDENHHYLEKFSNRLAIGEQLRVKVYVSEGKSAPIIPKDAKPNWKFKTKYDEDEFVPMMNITTAFVTQSALEKTSNVWLTARLFDEKGQRIGQAQGKMIKYSKQKPVPTKYWLMTGEECDEGLEKTYGSKKKPMTARGIPQMQIRLVYDRTHYPRGWMYQDYYPAMYVDEFWMTDDQLIKFNRTGDNSFKVEMHFGLMSAARHRFQNMMEHSFKQNAKMFGEDSEELLAMRDLFANTHPYLLIATMVVSVLHCIFEYLALKSDVVFWQNTDAKTLSSFISLRAVMLEIFCNIVLLIYLYDQDSNFLVLILSACQVLVDCWKLTRVLKFTCARRQGGFIPMLGFESKVPKTSSEDYDKIALSYLSFALVPIIIGYAYYSAAKECHKSWMSFVLHSAATQVYALGFALMTPQLFINYRMKSVANLPWRRFIYRAINTFIDDLFSFIIKMPTMHRMSCFRDDLVFVVYLYQRRVYPVDMSRNFDEDAGPADDDAAPAVENKKGK